MRLFLFPIVHDLLEGDIDPDGGARRAGSEIDSPSSVRSRHIHSTVRFLFSSSDGRLTRAANSKDAQAERTYLLFARDFLISNLRLLSCSHGSAVAMIDFVTSNSLKVLLDAHKLDKTKLDETYRFTCFSTPTSSYPFNSQTFLRNGLFFLQHAILHYRQGLALSRNAASDQWESKICRQWQATVGAHQVQLCDS